MSGAALPAFLPLRIRSNPWISLWLAVLVGTIVLMIAKESVPLAFKYPSAWKLPLDAWISSFMKWLINDLDFGLFTFKEFTRSIAWLVEQPYLLVKKACYRLVSSKARAVMQNRYFRAYPGWR